MSVGERPDSNVTVDDNVNVSACLLNNGQLYVFHSLKFWTHAAY